MMNYGDDMEVIKDKKYMRIQGEELAYKTKSLFLFFPLINLPF